MYGVLYSGIDTMAENMNNNDKVLVPILGVILVLFASIEWYVGEAYDVTVSDRDQRFVLLAEVPEQFFFAIGMKAVVGALLIIGYIISAVKDKHK